MRTQLIFSAFCTLSALCRSIIRLQLSLNTQIYTVKIDMSLNTFSNSDTRNTYFFPQFILPLFLPFFCCFAHYFPVHFHGIVRQFHLSATTNSLRKQEELFERKKVLVDVLFSILNVSACSTLFWVLTKNCFIVALKFRVHFTEIDFVVVKNAAENKCQKCQSAVLFPSDASATTSSSSLHTEN